MARKKTQAVAAAEIPSILDEDGFLVVPTPLLWRWRAHEAELRSATLEMEQAQAFISSEIEKNPTLKEWLAKKAALVGQMSNAKSEVSTIQALIETTMGVSLKDCAFDDKTGRLYNLAEDGSQGTPKKPVKKPRSKR